MHENHTLKHMNAYFERKAEQEKYKYLRPKNYEQRQAQIQKHREALQKDPHYLSDRAAYDKWMKENKESELAREPARS